MLLLLTGLAASLIAFVAARHFVKAEDSSGRWLLGIGLFIVLNLAGRSVVKPYAEERKRMENPVYRAVKAHEPDIYEQLKEIDPDSHLQLITEVRLKTAGMLAKYAPRASDEALLTFLRLSVEQMDALSAGGTAFDAIFPGNGTGLAKVASQLTEEKVQQQMAALAAIIDTGAKSEPKTIDEARVNELLSLVSASVYSSQTAGVQSLAEPSSIPPQNRDGAVASVRAFYAEILSLPPGDAAMVTRHLLSRAGTGS